MKLKHTPVIFRHPNGNLITNDPVLKAHQMLGEDISEFISQPTSAGVGEVSRTQDDEDIDTDPYADMTGAELKQAAQDRGVDIKGLRKVGEVRQALRDADAAAEDASDEADEDEDDPQADEKE